jgi:hypothetical protein
VSRVTCHVSDSSNLPTHLHQCLSQHEHAPPHHMGFCHNFVVAVLALARVSSESFFLFFSKRKCFTTSKITTRVSLHHCFPRHKHAPFPTRAHRYTDIRHNVKNGNLQQAFSEWGLYATAELHEDIFQSLKQIVNAQCPSAHGQGFGARASANSAFAFSSWAASAESQGRLSKTGQVYERECVYIIIKNRRWQLNTSWHLNTSRLGLPCPNLRRY